MPRPTEWATMGEAGPKLRDIDDSVGLVLNFTSGIVGVPFDLVGPGAYVVIIHGNEHFPVGRSHLFVRKAEIESAPEIPLSEIGG